MKEQIKKVIDNATGDNLELHSQIRRRVLSILVENNSGSLSSIVGLFSARGFNIDSLCVAPTETPLFSRLTIVTTCYDENIEQIKKQLHKLIDVHTVRNLTDEAHVSRELLIVKIKAKSRQQRASIKHLTDIFRARVIDVSKDQYIVEVTGHYKKTKAFINALKPSWILETVFSGVNSMGKSEDSGFWKPILEHKELSKNLQEEDKLKAKIQAKKQIEKEEK